jgi:hypothetical protein
MANDKFEDLAQDCLQNGAGAHHVIGASQIRAQGVVYEQQEEAKFALICLNKELARLDATLSSHKGAVDKFNEDSGKLYETLNLWTKVIAFWTIVSAIATCVSAIRTFMH